MVKEKSKPEKVKSPEEEFVEKVAELKKEKSKEELLEIVSIQPFNHELRDFMAARKALDEMKVEYPLTAKVQCEERDTLAGFGKVKAEKPVEAEVPKEEESKKKL